MWNNNQYLPKLKYIDNFRIYQLLYWLLQLKYLHEVTITLNTLQNKFLHFINEAKTFILQLLVLSWFYFYLENIFSIIIWPWFVIFYDTFYQKRHGHENHTTILVIHSQTIVIIVVYHDSLWREQIRAGYMGGQWNKGPGVSTQSAPTYLVGLLNNEKVFLQHLVLKAKFTKTSRSTHLYIFGCDWWVVNCIVLRFVVGAVVFSWSATFS